MIKFKRLRENATIPQYATDGAAGLDLTYAPEEGGVVFLDPGKRHVFETGLSCAIPYGYCGVIMPRSGLAVNFGIDKLAGLIDADYRGEIKVVLVNHGSEQAPIVPGDRIAQLVILPVYMTHVVEADELPSDEDGNDEGYLVEYLDGGKPNHPDHKGYISWSPKEQFDNGYELLKDPEAKTFGNTDVNGAKKNVPDLVVFGNGDLFRLLSKASSQSEGWMKSTKAMEIPGAGCVVQVTTQQGKHIAEAVTFVPGVRFLPAGQHGPGGKTEYPRLVSIEE